MSTTPRWADERLSAELSGICEEGESSTIEFKERFPEQGHKTAKELAALATSGGGILFVGINDDCEIVGLDAHGGKDRDELRERALGIVRQVSPQPTAAVLFAAHDDLVVLAVVVSKQEEPVFYYDGRPYVRDGLSSRVASPDEVKRLIKDDEALATDSKQPNAARERTKARSTTEVSLWPLGIKVRT